MSESATTDGGSHLAHHFVSAEQQYDAGKLGMWIFLVTEVLFFSGLFVAYAVYRSNHPELFVYAHQFLNAQLGGLNTIVLLCSSLSMAWAVRCAQLDQRKGLVLCLVTTLAFAGLFMGVKSVEYASKWSEGLLWASAFAPQHAGDAYPQALLALSTPAALSLLVGAILFALSSWRGRRKPLDNRASRRQLGAWSAMLLATSAAFFLGVAAASAIMSADSHPTQHSAELEHETGSMEAAAEDPASDAPRLAGVFFSIYFAMTGVHAVHILVGMGVIGWITLRSARGAVTSQNFALVDNIGLYWHLVDLVWIYLFPLLYLIR